MSSEVCIVGLQWYYLVHIVTYGYNSIYKKRLEHENGQWSIFGWTYAGINPTARKKTDNGRKMDGKKKTEIEKRKEKEKNRKTKKREKQKSKKREEKDEETPVV